uniref:Uncharacterized protein n=1 Tax=Cannabis sativa TaxID=3483 RepID=A0A803PR58_CANSA
MSRLKLGLPSLLFVWVMFLVCMERVFVHVPFLYYDRLFFGEMCDFCDVGPEVVVYSRLGGPLFEGCYVFVVGPRVLSYFDICGPNHLMSVVDMFRPLGEFISNHGGPMGLVLKLYLVGCSGWRPLAVWDLIGPNQEDVVASRSTYESFLPVLGLGLPPDRFSLYKSSGGLEIIEDFCSLVSVHSCTPMEEDGSPPQEP